MSLKVTVLIDASESDPTDPQFEDQSTFEAQSMEFYVVTALRTLNHQVRVLPFYSDVQRVIRELTSSKVDVVFNLTEGVDNDRRKDVHVATLLELLNIAYTGSSPFGLMLSRDKALSKYVLSCHKVKVPDFISIPIGNTRLHKNARFPMLVKPQMGDGSESISLRSLVQTEKELIERICFIHSTINQSAICEQYIEGRELRVFITGNDKLHVYPIREVKFGNTRKGPKFQTERVKTDKEYREKWQITYQRADIPQELEAHIAKVSKQIYCLLNLRDYARLDMRLTPHGEVYFLEANANPSLYPNKVINGKMLWYDSDYTQAVGRIVRLAIQRTQSH